jgi:hypothetical protein
MQNRSDEVMMKITMPKMQNNRIAEVQECINAGQQLNTPEVLNV